VRSRPRFHGVEVAASAACGDWSLRSAIRFTGFARKEVAPSHILGDLNRRLGLRGGGSNVMLNWLDSGSIVKERLEE
jgi:hypothetical protein